MSAFWLKLIGTTGTGKGVETHSSYEKDSVGLGRKPRRMKSGDFMVLYAVGGSKRIFALAQIVGDVQQAIDGNKERWPYRVKIKYLVNLPVSSGVHIDEISTDERDLGCSVRQASYIELSAKEYSLAEKKLRKASDKSTQS